MTYDHVHLTLDKKKLQMTPKFSSNLVLSLAKTKNNESIDYHLFGSFYF